MQRLSQEDGDFLTVELRKAEDEHVRLNQLLQNLRGTCDKFYSLEGCHGCGKEKVASCQGRLISFKHVFLELVIKHFRNEEKIMFDIFHTQDTNENFRLHQQEHDKLLHELESLMRKLSTESERGRTSAAIREFHHQALDLFGDHFRNFDDEFLRQQMNEVS